MSTSLEMCTGLMLERYRISSNVHMKINTITYEQMEFGPGKFNPAIFLRIIFKKRATTSEHSTICQAGKLVDNKIWCSH